MNITELYTPGAISRLKKKKKILTVIAFCVLAATAAACFFLLFTVNTANAERNEYLALIINAAGGCTALFLLLTFVIYDARQITHAQNVSAGERLETVYVCAPTVSGKSVRIPKSVEVRPVTVRTPLGEEHFRIDESLLSAFRCVGSSGRLYTVNGYITAFAPDEEKGGAV